MLTPSCDLLPSASFSSLIIDSAYQRDHLFPLEPGMSDAEALTLADFGFPDEESVQHAGDSWFAGGQVEETKSAPRNAKSNSVSEAVDVAWTTKTSGEEFAAGPGYGYTAFRAANPDPDGKKKKGRPVGRRKSVHMKPKTEVSSKASLTTIALSEPLETKNEEGEDEIKVESTPTPARDAILSSDSEMEKADAELSRPAPTSPTSAPIGYAAFRLANPGAKKVGRPVGWKMGAHSKRTRIAKQKARKKTSKKLADFKDGSKILAAIEMKGEQGASPFNQADGEVSTQLDQKSALEELSLQLNSPTYANIDKKQESMDLDADSILPSSFWQGVLAAANTSTLLFLSTTSEIILDPKSSTEPDDQGGRRDSAHHTVPSPFPSLTALSQDALPDSADETTQDDESGSSDMSHFSA